MKTYATNITANSAVVQACGTNEYRKTTSQSHTHESRRQEKQRKGKGKDGSIV